MGLHSSKKYGIIEVTWLKEFLFQVMLAAHEMNVTLNQFVEQAIRHYTKSSKITRRKE